MTLYKKVKKKLVKTDNIFQNYLIFNIFAISSRQVCAAYDDVHDYIGWDFIEAKIREPILEYLPGRQDAV